MIFSDHFKNTLKLIAIIVVLLLGGYLWMYHSIKNTILAPKLTLPPNDTEQIRVDPSTHQLTVINDKGTHTVTLPDRLTTIDVLKDGSVKVISPQFGFEHHFFLGATISDTGRLGVGMDIFYYKKLDVGLGIADQFGLHTPIAFAKLTYNVKGNLQAGLIYGTNQYIGGVLAVRVF